VNAAPNGPQLIAFDRAGNLPQVERNRIQFQFSCLDLLIIENVFNDLQQRIDRDLNSSEILALFGRRSVPSTSSVIPRTPFTGVRISWLAAATS
jgi:hypothetical protein